MTRSASLPGDVKALLRQGYDRSVELNSNIFAQEIRNPAKPRDALSDWADGLRSGGLKSMTPFELSVRLLGVLEELKAEEESDEDPEGHVTALLTCEFHIYKLNCGTPLRFNPFLYHWVLTSARIQHTLPEELVPWHWKARLEIIRLALTSPGVEDGLAERGSKNMEKRSPQSIAEKVQKERLQTIDLKPFARLLEMQGLPITEELASYLAMEDYVLMSDQRTNRPAHDDVLHDLAQYTNGPPVAPHETAFASSENSNGSVLSPTHGPDTFLNDSPSLANVPNDKGKSPAPQVFPLTSHSTLSDIQKAFNYDPQEAMHTLTRLPIDLASLDLLTRLLESATLNAETASTLTREYVQHSLRIIERLGTTFSPDSDSGAAFDPMIEGLPTGKDEQARAVKLLVLFMKNLLRKGLLPVQELLFDLREISTRYIWIPEVREFTNFLEGGDGVVASGGTTVDGTSGSVNTGHSIGG
ncbi:uncharacterized protein PV09_08232 [Verruconis gallopava]|uniref:Uncharacterized protein n=1 Tax=Verruconis gallopava TaxID=253628 RepID=A0A0D1YH87_9PEZI|nr:uncharacterized protein PV09_08232 [Verruconis gallopava]KIW00192.1 hypothetical protein PV09_08232 [Verruconis gallopava]